MLLWRSPGNKITPMIVDGSERKPSGRVVPGEDWFGLLRSKTGLRITPHMEGKGKGRGGVGGEGEGEGRRGEGGSGRGRGREGEGGRGRGRRKWEGKGKG